MDYTIAALSSLIDDNQLYWLTFSFFPGAIYRRINRHVSRPPR